MSWVAGCGKGAPGVVVWRCMGRHRWEGWDFVVVVVLAAAAEGRR